MKTCRSALSPATAVPRTPARSGVPTQGAPEATEETAHLLAASDVPKTMSSPFSTVLKSAEL